MVSYNFLDGVRDFIGLASTVTVILLLASNLQPQIQRFKNARRADHAHLGRTQLLWSACIIPVAWLAAAGLYIHNLRSLWLVMGSWLEEQPVNRPVYAFLHLYLFFLILGGIYALAITVFEMYQNLELFGDLWMVVRFDQRRRQTLEDEEAHYGPLSPDSMSAITESRSTVDECLSWNAREFDDEFDSGTNGPIGKGATRTKKSPIVDCSARCLFWFTRVGCDKSEVTRSSNDYQSAVDSDGDGIIKTPSSLSSSNASSGIDELEYVDEDTDRYDHKSISIRSADDDDDDSSSLYNATPRLEAQDLNAGREVEPLDIGEPLSPCDSCSSVCARLIPTAKRSPNRVPITPTSPTADAEDADTEMADHKRKQRERRNRSVAMSQTTDDGQTSSTTSSSDTSTQTSRSYPQILTYTVEHAKVLMSFFRATAPEASNRVPITRPSDDDDDEPQPNPAPVSRSQKPLPSLSETGESEAVLTPRTSTDDADDREGERAAPDKGGIRITDKASLARYLRSGRSDAQGVFPKSSPSAQSQRPGSPLREFLAEEASDRRRRRRKPKGLSIRIPDV